jgi:hypothetical protein
MWSTVSCAATCTFFIEKPVLVFDWLIAMSGRFEKELIVASFLN